MLIKDLNLHDSDITDIEIQGKTLILEAYHYDHVKNNKQVFYPVECLFSGVSNIRFLQESRTKDGHDIFEELTITDWDAHSRIWNEKIKKDHPEYIFPVTERSHVMKQITREEFLKLTHAIQSKATMPMGIADVYYNDNYFQIDTHSGNRLTFNYEIVKIYLNPIPVFHSGKILVNNGFTAQIPERTENNA